MVYKHFSFSYDPGANALESAIAAVSKYGGASAGYRTMLDAFFPASTVLKEVSRNYFSDLSFLPFIFIE